MNSRPAGQVRSSEIITTFGPGSVFNGKEGVSVMILGLDAWPEAFEGEEDVSKFKIIHNKFLEDVCKKEHFRMPMSDDGYGAGIPCTVFPSWGYCEFCKRMSKVEGKPDQEKGYYVCKSCQREHGHKNKILPARLVLLCDYGHVRDFPWVEWAHSKTKYQEAGICGDPVVKWDFGRGGTTLSNYRVKCTNCTKSRSMFGATEPLDQVLPDIDGGALELKCDGNSPWLGKKVMCPPKRAENREKRYMRGNHVRASNMYFPMIISALQIPRFQNPIQITIEKKRQVINYLREKDVSLEEIAKDVSIFGKNPDVDKIVDELRYRFDDSVDDEQGIKVREYNDLIRTSDIDYHVDREISIADVRVHPELQPYITKVKKLDRLTMIKAVRFFTRGTAPDPYDYESTVNKNTACKISKSAKIDWLPCVETKGEGIFFTLDERKLKLWEESSGERCKKIIDAFANFNSKRGWSGNITPRYILLHTLSHVLIRTLADSSGYGESSISERIYSGENMNAILLYTSSSSSEGSLGGIVRNAATDEFMMVMKNAINKSRMCSRDPLCRESNMDEGPTHVRLNGSACYACTLLPETSCENFNRLLDRKILADEQIGFFGDYG